MNYNLYLKQELNIAETHMMNESEINILLKILHFCFIQFNPKCRSLWITVDTAMTSVIQERNWPQICYCHLNYLNLRSKCHTQEQPDPGMGNFDKTLTSNIRCGNTLMTFNEFTEFCHEPENECHRYRVNFKENFKLDDISKI